jgi:hypothetical protein
MERDTRLQGIFTSLLTYLFISKALRKERSFMFPKSGAPMETDAHSRALLNVSFRVPSKGALPSGPPHGVPSEREIPFLEPSFIHHSKSPVYKPPSPDSRFRSDIEGPLLREMPVSGAFLNISSRVTNKGDPPQRPSALSLFREERSISTASFILLSKSLVDAPLSRFPSGAPVKKDVHLQSLFYLSSRVPSKGALPPGSLHRAPIERNVPPPEPLQPSLKVPGRRAHFRLPN